MMMTTIAASTSPPPWFDRRAHLPAPTLRADLRYSPLDDHAILLDPLTQSTFHLNPTARFVFLALQSPTSILRIAQDLAEQYRIPVDTALDDVEQLLALFASHDLLHIASATTDESPGAAP